MRAHLGLVSIVVASVVSSGAALAASTGDLKTIENPGGGTIVSGTLGSRSSAQAAAAAMLSHVHATFGARPTVLQAVQNPAEHSLTLLFTEARNRQPYTGMAIVTATPGSTATGVVLYDTSARFPKTVGSMMKLLQNDTVPDAGTAHVPLAPAEPLVTRQFSDGTGTIGVPSDWTLRSAEGGSALATGPTGKEIAAFNSLQGALDPTYGIGLEMVRGTGMGGVPLMRANAFKRSAFMSYSSDPVSAWTKVWDQMAKQQGKTGPHFVVKSSTSMGAGSAEIVGTGSAPEPVTYVAYVSVLPPNAMGQWNINYSYVVVPTNEVVAQGATAAAVLNSSHIDAQAFAAKGKAIRDMFQKQFDAEIALDRLQDTQRQARTDEFMANDASAQEGMHKVAVATENYSLDRAVVVNTQTGGHATVGTNFASTLVQNNPNLQIVPANQLERGVDY